MVVDDVTDLVLFQLKYCFRFQCITRNQENEEEEVEKEQEREVSFI